MVVLSRASIPLALVLKLCCAICLAVCLRVAGTAASGQVTPDSPQQLREQADPRPPRDEQDLQRWLENMVRWHRFSDDEVAAATGLSLAEVRAAVARGRLRDPGREPVAAAAAEPLRVLPYPGGRHPRIGFLDGAVRPQRETKISVFTPWDRSSYVVVDVPEAIWSNLGLTYLAHTHVETIWTKQQIELPQLEWQTTAYDELVSRRRLPNGIEFGSLVKAHADHVQMEMWLTNGTSERLTDLRVQNCVMFKAAAGFSAQTNDNKLFRGSYVACRSQDGRRWIITAWEPLHRGWANAPCPCLHADPKFPDCAPGETQRLRGWLSFYEGPDIGQELERIERSGWKQAAFLAKLIPIAASGESDSPPAATKADTAEPPARAPVEHDSLQRDYARELPRIPATEPAAALAKFSIADGFRVELAASEPLVTDPVAMAFDERGRLYVVEMRGYSENPDDQLGQVRLLEDVDDDGLFDKSSIFLDKLSWPTAIACYDGGVLVGVAPDILFCRDTDGDRRADVREVVFTGFARDNVQGLLNSFVWGLDQRLYGATSSSGGEVRALRHPQQPPIDLGHRDFAIDPRTMNLVAVSGGGQHGLSFDRFGNRYASANSDHIQLFEMDERYLDRNPLLANSNPRRSIAADGPAAEVYRTSPVEPWRIVRTRLRVKGMVSGPIEGGGRAAGYFTGATGVTIYTGDAFPDPYRQQTFAFIGDVGGNLVHQKRVDDNGLSKIARRVDEGREFLASSDNWFRPVQFANGPDGALYVLDMYRETIEHPLSLPPLIKQHLDLTSGRDRGRIYRVVPATYQRRSRPLPGNASLGELIGMLAHPNGWHRETAARMLLAGDPAQVGPALARAVRSRWQKTAGKDSAWEANPAYVPDAIVRALYCLEVLGKLTSADLSAALRDEDAEVRRHAIPLVEGRFGGPGGQDLVRQLVQMVSDPDPHVREQIALTLGDLPPEMKLAPLARLVAQTTAIDGNDSLWRTAILSSVGDCRVDFALRLLTRSSNLPQPFSDRLLQELIEEIGRGVTRSSPQSGAQLVTLIATLRRLPDSAPARQWIGTLLVSSKIQGDQLAEFLQQDGLADAATWLASLADQARAMAMKEGESGTERGEALRLLRIVAPAKAIEVARDFLVPGQLFDLQLVAVEVLGSYRNPIASEILLRRVSDMQTGAKRRAYDLLLQRRESSRLVAEGLLAGRVPVADLTASQRAALLANEKGGEPDRLGELFTRAEAARQQVLERYQDVLASTGDVPRGREVFRRVCASCHRLEEQGFAVGPDLAVLVSRGAAFLMTNILDPNREIDPRYESYLIVTADGRTLTGIIRGETGSAVEIALANGVQESIPRSEIAEMRGTGLSLMPVGMEQDITPEAMADLLAYLQSLDRLRATGTDVGP